MKITISIIVLGFLLILPSVLLAHGDSNNNHFAMDSMMGDFLMGSHGFVSSILFWPLLIIGVVLIIRWAVGPKNEEVNNSALDILKKRYVRGEIDKKEFEEKKKDLN